LQFSRLALDVPLSHETASPALGAAIARALDMPDFRAVESKLAEVQAAVQVIFDAQFQAA
jgi:hypothetical protein